MFGQLKSVVYSESGDMLGSLYSVEAERTDSGVTVTVRTSKMHSDPIEVSEYRGDDNLLDQVEAIIDGAGMKEWGDLPPSEFIALDAATKSLRAQFDSADPNDAWPEWLSYSFNDQLPDNGESIRQIYDLMVANTGEDRLIRTYVEEPR